LMMTAMPSQPLVSACADWREAALLKGPESVVAMLGMAGPVAVGTFLGNPRIGIAASLAGLALSAGRKGEPHREQACTLVYGMVAGALAMVAGSAMTRFDLAASGIPAAAAAAALIGGLSRPMARASTQFILFVIIATSLRPGGTNPFCTMILFCIGSVWTIGLSLVSKRLMYLLRPVPPSSAASGIGQPLRYPVKQLLRRWRTSLTGLCGWLYPLRLTACLIAAGVYEWLWPRHHGYWVAITVVLVVQRPLQSGLKRTFQRAAGTAIGVVLTAPLLFGAAPIWLTVGMIAALAVARPILMEVSYTAYAAVMTPLVILLIDFGQGPSRGVVVDRLAATAAGGVLSMTLGYLGWSRLSLPACNAAAQHGTQL
jgi:Fusaric acid resistance protein-like